MLGWLVIRPLGIMLLGVGVVTLPTPIPFGALLIAAGVILLVSVSRTWTGYIFALRKNFPRFDAVMVAIEARLSKRFSKLLRKTRPPRRFMPERYRISRAVISAE